MIAITLAAGEGTRLRPHTLDRPKCLVEIGGRPILAHQIESLRAAGVRDHVLVTGYRADCLAGFGMRAFHNPDFAETNMVDSLFRAAELFDGRDDLLVIYGDIVFEPRLIRSVVSCAAPLATTIDLEWEALWRLRMADPLADAETLRLDAEGRLVEIGRKPRSLEEIEGQYMGIIQIRRDAAPGIAAFHAAIDPAGTYEGRTKRKMFMTAFLQLLVDNGHPVQAVPVRGGWLEVDTVEELALYERLLREDLLSGRYRPCP